MARRYFIVKIGDLSIVSHLVGAVVIELWTLIVMGGVTRFK